MHQHDIARLDRRGCLGVRLKTAERSCKRDDGQCHNNSSYLHPANS